MEPQETPVNHFYNSRSNFTIVGLTGLAGSGCSTLAELMSENSFWDNNNVRVPKDLPFSCETRTSNAYQEEDRKNIEAVSQLVFNRKYTICYNYVKENYKSYKIIKYTKVVLLYTLLYSVERCNAKSAEEIKSKFTELLSDKFYPSKSHDTQYINLREYGKFINVDDIIESFDWENIYKSLKPITDKNFIDIIENGFHARDKSVTRDLSKYFFEDNNFISFTHNFIDKLYKKDYYCLCFLFHRLTACIRNCGDPFKPSKENYLKVNKKYNHLFDVVKLINLIIKGLHYTRDSRRIVIDSIRNSMEALYFKERYTAFYLVAVHDDEHREEHLKKKIQKSFDLQDKQENKYFEPMYKSLKRFLDIETDSDDYEDGKFHSPNVGQCIADAEIHIANIKGIDKSAKIFYTMAEQWMKYAALILHPGLITPSSEERCMIVAYTAKYNSGCLSRQVGACITNQYHTIRTIGWNDVPYGQIPCSLREISDIYSEDKKSFYNYMYSDFEKPQKGNELKLYDNECYSFKEKVQNDYKQIEEHKDQLKGLPLSYCFKSLHNKYEGEKNQVYTRSLHAEENAMMQMVKYGGEALINGIIYVTASPCELCSKKLYQIGVRKIVYIDPYPGISKRHIIACGFKRPELKLFQGAYGSTYFKLYQPFMSYKDELGIRVGNTQYETKNYLLKRILKGLNKEFKATYTHEEISEILNKLDLDNKN